MKTLPKIVKIIAFVAFVYGGQLFSGGFDFSVYAEWKDRLKQSTQAPIENNTESKLKEIKCQSKEDLDEGYICFEGELEVSGMLVREESKFGDIVYLVLDKNFHLPARWFGKPSSAEAVLLTADNTLLPQPLQKRTLGGVGIMAKIKIKDYKYLHKYGYMNNDLYTKATLIEATPFSNAEYIQSYIHRYYEWEGCVDDRHDCYYLGKYNHFKDDIGSGFSLLTMHYNSKDSFVNLRDKPNGNVIAKIYAKDMRCGKEKGRIYLADKSDELLEQLMRGKKEWVKVFYLPNIEIMQDRNVNFIDVSKAIFGYIHSSQLKVSCK